MSADYIFFPCFYTVLLKLFENEPGTVYMPVLVPQFKVYLGKTFAIYTLLLKQVPFIREHLVRWRGTSLLAARKHRLYTRIDYKTRIEIHQLPFLSLLHLIFLNLPCIFYFPVIFRFFILS
jgi:hypothetical protein